MTKASRTPEEIDADRALRDEAVKYALRADVARDGVDPLAEAEKIFDFLSGEDEATTVINRRAFDLALQSPDPEAPADNRDPLARAKQFAKFLAG